MSAAMTPTANIISERHALSSQGAVAWGAILAGAAGAAALSLVLLILGAGLGLTVVSPWDMAGTSAAAVGFSALAWVAFTQLAASGLGGYLAGRLRTRWSDLAVDEVFFRDTAHGFLAWAVSSVAMAALLGSVSGAIVGSGVQAGATVAAQTGSAAVSGMQAQGEDRVAYFTDVLFRRSASPMATADASAPAPVETEAASSREATRIFQSALMQPGAAVPPDDLQYLAQLVAQRTGLSPADAQKRVADTHARMQQARASAQEAADKARKASATAALWIVVSLFIGAFVASLAATFGGRLRDA
jgi:hypothetical protein